MTGRRAGSSTRRKWTCPKCGAQFQWVMAPKCLACGFSVDGRPIEKGTDFGEGLLIGSGDTDDDQRPLDGAALNDPYMLDEGPLDDAAIAAAMAADLGVLHDEEMAHEEQAWTLRASYDVGDGVSAVLLVPPDQPADPLQAWIEGASWVTLGALAAVGLVWLGLEILWLFN